MQITGKWVRNDPCCSEKHRRKKDNQLLALVNPEKGARWGGTVTAYTTFYVSLELCAPNNKNVNIVLKLFVPLKNKSDCTKEFYSKMVTQIYIY